MIGIVEDINDPLKMGRVKVRIKGLYEALKLEDIPWSTPRFSSFRTYDLPPLKSIVEVELIGGSKQLPVWFIRGSGDAIPETENYQSGAVLLDKHLEEYGDEGSVRVSYFKQTGLVCELTHSGKTSKTEILADGSVRLTNGVTGKIVHISKDGISLGTDTKSKEPAVLGDQNVLALSKLNTTRADEVKVIANGLNALSVAAMASPYTMPLVAPFKALIEALNATEKNGFAETESQIKKTPSKIVNLD